MPKFVIEQYELHQQTYEVEAPSAAEAIAKLLNGDVDATDNGAEYIEVAQDFGLPVDEHRELAQALRALNVYVSDDLIPSIRSIEEVPD